MKGKIILVLSVIAIVITSIPFLSVELKVEWLAYLAIPFAVLGGAAGLKFIEEKIAGVIGGFVIGIVLWELLALLISSR